MTQTILDLLEEYKFLNHESPIMRDGDVEKAITAGNLTRKLVEQSDKNGLSKETWTRLWQSVNNLTARPMEFPVAAEIANALYEKIT